MSTPTLHGATHERLAGRRDVVDRADRGRLGSASGSPLLLLPRLTPTSPLHDALLQRYRHLAQDQRVTPVIPLTLEQAS